MTLLRVSKSRLVRSKEPGNAFVPRISTRMLRRGRGSSVDLCGTGSCKNELRKRESNNRLCDLDTLGSPGTACGSGRSECIQQLDDKWDIIQNVR